jgi:hypothetical protein
LVPVRLTVVSLIDASPVDVAGGDCARALGLTPPGHEDVFAIADVSTIDRDGGFLLRVAVGC